jgi:hypothetical protein
MAHGSIFVAEQQRNQADRTPALVFMVELAVQLDVYFISSPASHIPSTQHAGGAR